MPDPSRPVARVVASSAAGTAPLRKLVLRPHDSLAELSSVGGQWFAVHRDDVVVATAGVVREDAPTAPRLTSPAGPAGAPGASWRIRGMAVHPDLRGAGLGSLLLAAVIDHATRAGGRLMWCNARTGAVTLYQRSGLEVLGEVWVDPVLGPHVRMWRWL